MDWLFEGGFIFIKKGSKISKNLKVVVDIEKIKNVLNWLKIFILILKRSPWYLKNDTDPQKVSRDRQKGPQSWKNKTSS